jgi:diguanylate cyclase (GGDEF)-like protein/PAS domain S-box-containing protein
MDDKAARPCSDERNELLTKILDEHPQALVSAIDDAGRFIPLPPTLVLTGQRMPDGFSALSLVVPQSRRDILDVWDAAREDGAASVDITLSNGVRAVYHIIDVRHRHGVLVGIAVPAAGTAIDALDALALEVMPKIGSIDKDEQAIIVRADDRICRILGYRPDELVGRRSLELLHPEDQGSAIAAWMEMIAVPGSSSRVRARHLRKDGSWIWLELTNTNRLDQSDGRIVTDMIDISDEKATEEALRQRVQLLGRLADALPTGILHVDRNRHVLYTNARLGQVLGLSAATARDTVDTHLATVLPSDRALLDAHLDRVLHDGRDADLEVHISKGGEPDVRLCSVAMRALVDTNGVATAALLCFDDITEASQLRAELMRRASIDELTGCLNRVAVLDALRQTLERTGSIGTAVVFLDLDGFKEVNDTFGHDAGDLLLAGAAGRMRAALRPDDVVGRLGGDEFIVVLADVEDPRAAMRVAQRITDSLARAVEVVPGVPIRIRSSIGVAWTPGPAAVGEVVSVSTLTSAADKAMYESKRDGACAPVLVSVADVR